MKQRIVTFMVGLVLLMSITPVQLRCQYQDHGRAGDDRGDH